MTEAKNSFRFVVLIILMTFVLVASGCVSTGGRVKQVSAGKSGGTLKYFLGEPVSIDPAFALEGEGLQVAKELFDGLIDYDPKTSKIKSAVAVRWRSNKAGDEWTFWLKEDVRFHNGRSVEAKDFIYAWNRVAAKKTASEVAYHLAPIKGFDKVQSGKKQKMSGLSAPERHVLKVKLNYPFADFPTVLGHPVFSPVPKEEVAKGKAKFALKPVGNGPFAMVGPWRHQRSITVERFDDYYDQKAYVDGVEFQINDNDQAAFLQFQGGALDYAPIPGGQIGIVQDQFADQAVIGQPQQILNLYGFNLRKAPFKGNAKLRRAINYAVNRNVIADEIYEGAFISAGSIVPPGVTDYRQPKTNYKYSPAKAKSLLKAAGYPRGKGLPTIKLVYSAGRGLDAPAQIFQENMRALGIKVKLAGLERGAFIKAMMSGDMSMFAATWFGDYPSRDSFLYSLFHSDSGDNVFGYGNERVDELIIEARTELDPEKRRRFYDEAEELILKDAPLVPLTFVGTSFVHALDLQGFVRTSMDNTPLDRVWLAD